jgi:2-keto-4-pentenoate hydratase
VAIEVVDSRWSEGLQAPALAKQADQMCHGALVLGEWLPFDPTHDWATQGGSVAITGQPTRRFQGSHPLGDPAWLLPAWLRHATRGGVVLPAGSVVTTGSWCGLPMAAAGDEVVVSFDSLGEARLRL